MEKYYRIFSVKFLLTQCRMCRGIHVESWESHYR